MLLPLLLIGSLAVLIFTMIAGSMTYFEKQGNKSPSPPSKDGDSCAEGRES
jgi:hypothetical protein